MEIRKDSLLYSEGARYDYVDSFEYVIADTENRISIVEVAEMFSQPGPKWFDGLFALRDKIASVLGLKTAATVIKEGECGRDRWEPGAQAGMFKVFGKSETEMILGEDDKHLDVRISLLLDAGEDHAKKVTVTTAVRYNNRLGVAYFFVIKPFHRIMVPALLKRNFKRLKSEVNS